MSEKIDFEKIDYQERVLNSKEKYICEDWERGKGKTTTLLRKVLKPNEKVLWITRTISQFELLTDIISGKIGHKCKIDKDNNRLITVFLEEGNCRIYNATYNGEEDTSCIGRGYNVDNIVIDDIDIKFDYEFKKLINDRLSHPLKNGGQIINLYTSVKNYYKNLKDSDSYYEFIEKEVTYISNHNTGTDAEELNKAIKPNAKILIISNDKKDFIRMMSSINSENLECLNNYQARYYFDDENQIPIKFIDVNDSTIRGYRATDIFTIDLDLNNEKNKQVLNECIYPFLIPHENTKQCIITHIKRQEKLKTKTSDIAPKKTLIEEQINQLLLELKGIPKRENTTITREKIIDMIDKLCSINKNYNI